MVSNYQELINILKKNVTLATGCTEPIAVAYNASVAGQRIDDISAIEKIELSVDSALFKNALKVGIPGIEKRGLQIAAALGLVIAEPERELQILESFSEDEKQKAEELSRKVIFLNIIADCSRLFIEVFVTLKNGKNIKVVTMDKHKNITNIEEGFDLHHENPASYNEENGNKIIQKYGLKEMLEFSDKVALRKIDFLLEGVNANIKLAEEGLSLNGGIGAAYKMIEDEGLINDNLVVRAERLCSSASEARMSGSRLPTMSSAGSGNHGITLFLTIAGVAEKTGIEKEEMIRALALSNLITVYIKSYTGTLSAMCGCGVAAGIGASAGVAYMLGGTEEQIFKSMLNMVGSITGLICDGAKEGCSFKLALSSGWAVKSALLALKDVSIGVDNGILSGEFKELFENLGYLCNVGMNNMNTSILSIMQSKKDCYKSIS